jgi:anaphase-promoting complex subunit 8
MYSYALHYHQRAAALRPFDPKTWQAVGSCFALVGKTQNAIRAYKRALVAGSYYIEGGNISFADSEGDIASLGGGILDPECLIKIALLYQQLHEDETCAAYMDLVLAQEEGPMGDSELNPALITSQGSTATVPGSQQPQNHGGVGVTATTSRARVWLAKYAYRMGQYQRASELANELCQDGVEVEEAKALIRDIRSRIDLGTEERLRNE